MTKTAIPYHQLVDGDEVNARPTTKDGISALAASIREKGVISPLVVRDRGLVYPGNGTAIKAEHPTDTYEIIDGRRRHQAIAALVKAKAPGWTKTTMVPVIVRDESGADALETSLVANTVRLPMHPVDQHAVFARLLDQGRTIPEIAARFAVSEKTVRQHSALGRLAPEVREAWKKGKIEEGIAKIFTIAPDHTIQAAAFERLKKSGGFSEWRVRSELTNDRPRAASVSKDVLTKYIAAGGSIAESLFDDERYIEDGALLKKIDADRYEAEREKISADGWAWVAHESELSDEWRWNWKKHSDGREVEYLPSEASRISEIEKIEKDGVEDGSFDKLEEELDEIEERARMRAFTPEVRAKTGVVIEQLYGSGEFKRTLGVYRPDGEEPLADDEPEPEAAELDDDYDDDDDSLENSLERGLPPSNSAAEDDQPEPEDAGPYALSNTHLTSVTETLTRAAALAISVDHTLALRAAVAALSATGTFGYRSPVKLTASGYGGGHRGRIPEFTEVFTGLVNEDAAALMQRFALLVGAALDLRSQHAPSKRDQHEVLLAALPAAPYLEAARQMFSPADYFSRASKKAAIAALDEINGTGAKMSGAKKADLARTAADAAKTAGWLPPELRHPAYSLFKE